MLQCKHENAPEIWQEVRGVVLRQCPACHCVQYATDPDQKWHTIKHVPQKCAHSRVVACQDAHDEQMMECLSCGSVRYISDSEVKWYTLEDLGITKSSPSTTPDHLELAFQVRAYTMVELALKAKCPGREPQGAPCGCEVQLRFQEEEQDWIISCAGEPRDGLEPCGWFAYGTTLLNAAKARFV